MKLSHLTNKILLSDTKKLVGAEREATTQLLHHLKEIDRRKLFSDLKCSSLFDYCVRELGYSEASAQRRIVAARLLAQIPEIESKIEKGKLTLTNISQVNQFFKYNSPTEKLKILKEVEGLSKKQCEQKLFELSGKDETPPDTKKRVAQDKVQLTITISDKTHEKLEKLKALLSKDLSMDELVNFMADEAIQNVEKEKFKQVDKVKKSLPPAKVGRLIPASVKREVYKRDQKCTVCGSKHRLQFDHRMPYALGGRSSLENVRLLCFHCNQRSRMRAGLSFSSS